MSAATAQLARALENHATRLLLVVTGAGISRASGISTFRGAEPDAVWKVHDIEMATREMLSRDPVGQWSWYLERFRKVDGARPNPAHQALPRLEERQLGRGGRFRLVTQNIDTLHEQAGSRSLIKIHGTCDRVRCSQSGCELGAPAGSLQRHQVDLESFLENPAADTLPRCPACGAILRAHVLFFDEYYQEHRDYRFEDALREAEQAAVVLFIGTSFSVGITDFVCRSALRRGAPMFSIDPAGSPQAKVYGITEIREPAEEVLPDLLEKLSRN